MEKQLTQEILTRSKKRKVKKGLKIEMDCQGKKHTIYLTPKGHIVLANHTDEDLEVDMAMTGLGGAKICRCAEFLQAWRYANRNLRRYSKVVPRTIEDVRATTESRITGERLWRRYSKKKRYDSRHVPRRWPTKNTDVLEFLTTEFKRVGLIYDKPVYQISITEPPITLVVRSDLQAKSYTGDMGNASSSWYPDAINIDVSFDAPNRLFIQSYAIPGLSTRRIITKANFDMVLHLIGVQTWMNIGNRASQGYVIRAQESIQSTLTALKKKLSTNTDIRIKYATDSHTIVITTQQSLEELGSLSLIIRRFNKLLELSKEAIGNRPKQFEQFTTIWKHSDRQ